MPTTTDTTSRWFRRTLAAAALTAGVLLPGVTGIADAAPIGPGEDLEITNVPPCPTHGECIPDPDPEPEDDCPPFVFCGDLEQVPPDDEDPGPEDPEDPEEPADPAVDPAVEAQPTFTG